MCRDGEPRGVVPGGGERRREAAPGAPSPHRALRRGVVIRGPVDARHRRPRGRPSLVRWMGQTRRLARRGPRVLRRGHRAHARERVRGRGPLRHRARAAAGGGPRARSGEVRRRARDIHARRGRRRGADAVPRFRVDIIRHVAAVRARVIRAGLRRGFRSGRVRGGGHRRARRPGRRQSPIAARRTSRARHRRPARSLQARAIARVRRARLRLPRRDPTTILRPRDGGGGHPRRGADGELHRGARRGPRETLAARGPARAPRARHPRIRTRLDIRRRRSPDARGQLWRRHPRVALGSPGRIVDVRGVGGHRTERGGVAGGPRRRVVDERRSRLRVRTRHASR